MKNRSVTIRIDSNKYDKLVELASSIERPKSFVIEDALTNYLAVNEWQVNKIKKALIEAKDPNTKWISHEDVKKKYFKENEL